MNTSSKPTLRWLMLLAFFALMLYLLRAILLPFVLGIIVAYLLDPLVDRLQRLRLSRALATLVVTLVFFTTFIGTMIGVVPLVSEQLAGLIGMVPQLVDRFSGLYNTTLTSVLAAVPAGQVETVQNAFGNVSMVAIDLLSEVANNIFASGGAFLNLLSMLLITPIVAFYLLKDWDHILNVCETLLPRRHADTIREQVVAIDETLSGFLRGQLLVCLCLMGYYSLLLTLIGLPFGFLIGALSGALVIIPYVGWISCVILSLGIAFVHGGDGWHLMLSVAGVYLFAQAIESYYLTPKLVGERVGLHPLWLIFGMLSGGVLLGFVGVLLAVPMTAIIGVLIRFALQRYRESELYR